MHRSKPITSSWAAALSAWPSPTPWSSILTRRSSWWTDTTSRAVIGFMPTHLSDSLCHHISTAASLWSWGSEPCPRRAQPRLAALASAAEIVAYYQHVMERILLPTGRVTFLPMSDYQGDEVVVSRVTGNRHRLTARKKWVDATYTPSPVPATHTRSYEVAEGVTCVPINELPSE